MDKNSFETYEYLPADSDTDAGQLLVVQEDGTFLCFNRPIQYVSQVENDKEVLQGVEPNDVYGVTPQQLYIDANNAGELISVSDIIPDGENDVCNYLLPAEENAKEELMDQDEDHDFQVLSVNEETPEDSPEVENVEVKNPGDCTEITISDEQYQVLQDKGWILLEYCDKIYVLDSSGLHDITSDEKLILKLKCELQDDTNGGNVSSSIIQNEEAKGENTIIKTENIQSDDINTDEMEQYVIETPENNEEKEPHEVSNEREEISTSDLIEDDSVEGTDLLSIENEHDYVRLKSVQDSYAKKHDDTLRIKTRFSFKDIPPEIELGKYNGKKLMARVVKSEKLTFESNIMRPTLRNNDRETDNISDSNCLAEDKFEQLIREAVRGSLECSLKDVTGAEMVVGQLLRVPAFRPVLMERRLIITKTVIMEDEKGEPYGVNHPTIVTGRAVRDRSNNYNFRYMADMLWKLATIEGDKQDDNVELNDSGENNDLDFLHIHIRETKGVDGIIRISITLNKRHILLHLFHNIKQRHPKAVFACSACASVYRTEEGLHLHRESECVLLKNDKTSTNTQKSVSYTIVNTSKGKYYVCNVCNVAYTKLINCREHVKTHLKQDSNKETSTSQQNSQTGASMKNVDIFKCKMCDCAYLSAATLSKHIVQRHIKHTS